VKRISSWVAPFLILTGVNMQFTLFCRSALTLILNYP
jgi:hypothetical protein